MSEIARLDFYRAKIINVVDGDTIDAIVDTRFNTTTTTRLRLLGVNTAELRDSDPNERIRARDAKQFVINWVLTGTIVKEWPHIIWTKKSDSFGRYLAIVWPNIGDVGTDIFTNTTLNYHLIKAKHSSVYRPDGWPDFLTPLEDHDGEGGGR